MTDRILLRHAESTDLTSIMSIITDAQNHLAQQNVDQWQNGYPTPEIIEGDIQRKEMLLATVGTHEVVGMMMCSTRPDPTYDRIDGQWITPPGALYGVIHRMAVSAKHRKKGVAHYLFRQAEDYLREKRVLSIRLDTHHDNTGMQRLISRQLYQECGIIYVQSGDPRIAYEKLM